MVKSLKSVKKFGGHKYHREFIFTGKRYTKPRALNLAKSYRKKGIPSRVIKTKYGHLVYLRHYGRMPTKKR